MAASATAAKTQRIVMVCNFCGSEDVRLDAWAAWHADAQRWELDETCQAAWCNDCGGECSVAEKLR